MGVFAMGPGGPNWDLMDQLAKDKGLSTQDYVNQNPYGPMPNAIGGWSGPTFKDLYSSRPQSGTSPPASLNMAPKNIIGRVPQPTGLLGPMIRAGESQAQQPQQVGLNPPVRTETAPAPAYSGGFTPGTPAPKDLSPDWLNGLHEWYTNEYLKYSASTGSRNATGLYGE
jgi:hypothetical protein